jgi:two-component system chemotaxis response regulator CheB
MSDRLIRVLVVDDSAYVRKVLKEMLSRSPLIEVVGAAATAEKGWKWRSVWIRTW